MTVDGQGFWFESSLGHIPQAKLPLALALLRQKYVIGQLCSLNLEKGLEEMGHINQIISLVLMKLPHLPIRMFKIQIYRMQSLACLQFLQTHD